MYTVYMHKCTNGKVYIGITSRRPKARWVCGNGYIKNEHFYRAIQKYGWENIEHIIVEQNLSKNDAAELEIKLIKEYKSNDYKFGYNMSSGGEFGGSGVIVSQETRAKLSQKRKGRKLPEYVKNKISESLKGHYISEETKKKISQSLKAKNMNGNEKPVYCFETDKTYRSLSDAGKELNIKPCYISSVCKGKNKTVKGLHFKFAEVNK